jgi:hypothetical protein
MASGAAPMRPKAGLIRDLLEGSFPELYPELEPEPEPEEVKPAEPDAGARAEENEPEPENPPAEPEPEKAADDVAPEDETERPLTPELDAYEKRIAEIDAIVRAPTRSAPSSTRVSQTERSKTGALFHSQSPLNLRSLLSVRDARLTPGPLLRTTPSPRPLRVWSASP